MMRIFAAKSLFDANAHEQTIICSYLHFCLERNNLNYFMVKATATRIHFRFENETSSLRNWPSLNTYLMKTVTESATF